MDTIIDDSAALAEGYKLTRPIRYQVKDGETGQTVEKTLTHLKFKDEIEAGDLEVADEYDGVTKKNLAVIAHLSGQPMAIVRKLSPKDYAALAMKVQGE